MVSDQARATAGARLAGFIYGTIVALAVVVAGARAQVGEACLARAEQLTLAVLRQFARREGSIIEATVPLVAALLLGAIGVTSTEVSVWLAFGAGLVVLAGQGVRFARIERLGMIGTILVVAANLSLGVVFIAIKLALTH